MVALAELNCVNLFDSVHLFKNTLLQILTAFPCNLALSLVFCDVLVKLSHFVIAGHLLVDELSVLLLLLHNIFVERVKTFTSDLVQILLADLAIAFTDRLALIELGKSILRLLVARLRDLRTVLFSLRHRAGRSSL